MTVEEAARAYIDAAHEPDPARRMELLERCFAEDGRVVTGSRVIQGRAEVARMIDALHTDPRGLAVRVTSAVDARGSIFRFHSTVQPRDGAALEFFDAGEVGADGKIITILTFSGPLAR